MTDDQETKEWETRLLPAYRRAWLAVSAWFAAWLAGILALGRDFADWLGGLSFRLEEPIEPFMFDARPNSDEHTDHEYLSEKHGDEHADEHANELRAADEVEPGPGLLMPPEPPTLHSRDTLRP